ncbi:YrzA family protein [Paenibacillus sp. NPDC058071]|uniref:YrzA family protein n=1 Tax=Paenibacillus sp. NPDC058071 TaxID=3346326 RepID=UPI0036DB6EC1
MDFRLDLIDNKIEFFEAGDLRTLELKVDQQIENNKALLLDVHHVQHQVVFNPNSGKMQYSAVVHFKAKKG